MKFVKTTSNGWVNLDHVESAVQTNEDDQLVVRVKVGTQYYTIPKDIFTDAVRESRELDQLNIRLREMYDLLRARLH